MRFLYFLKSICFRVFFLLKSHNLCFFILFQIGQARFRAPEVLFRPDLVGDESEGIHEVLLYAIHKSDMDLRKLLFQNIVISGGSTLFKGFGDRLLSEVKKLAPKDIKIRVSYFYFVFL